MGIGYAGVRIRVGSGVGVGVGVGVRVKIGLWIGVWIGVGIGVGVGSDIGLLGAWYRVPLSSTTPGTTPCGRCDKVGGWVYNLTLLLQLALTAWLGSGWKLVSPSHGPNPNRSHTHDRLAGVRQWKIQFRGDVWTP